MAWPWTRREPEEDDLKTRLRRLEAGFRDLQLEWDSVVDKLLVKAARHRKREQRAAEAAEAETEQIPMETPTTDRKAALRARWAARRNGVRT